MAVTNAVMPNKQTKRAGGTILRLLPLIGMSGIVLLIIIFKDRLTLENLMQLSPDGTIASAFFVILLFCCKSLSIVFPLVLLYLLSGRLFSAGWAVIISLLGLAAGLSLQYGIGRISGSETIRYLRTRWPKIDTLVQAQGENIFLSAFLLRTLGLLPCDAVSMFFGAAQYSYFGFLFGSLLGLLPELILTTMLGISLSDPGSPMFWISVAGKILLCIGTVTGVSIRKKKTRS